MRWPSCKIPLKVKTTFAIQLPFSFERALVEATADVKAQKQEFDFNKEIVKHRRMMYDRAMSKVKNPEIAKDMVQCAFLKALEKNAVKQWLPATSNIHENLSAWLCRIVDNECISHFRRQRPISELNGHDVIYEEFTNHDEREASDRLFSHLNEDERLVMELTTESARITDITAVTGKRRSEVKVLQQQSKSKLRALIEKK